MQPVYKVVDNPKLTSGKLPLKALYVFEEVQPLPPITVDLIVKLPLVVYVYVKSKKLLPKIVLSPFPQNILYCWLVDAVVETLSIVKGKLLGDNGQKMNGGVFWKSLILGSGNFLIKILALAVSLHPSESVVTSRIA